MSIFVRHEVIDGCLVCLDAIAAGATVGVIEAEILDHPTRATLQLDAERHTDVPPPLLHLDHACDPNVWFDTDRRAIVALRDVAAGERMRLFYPASEWDMAAVFDCACGAESCIGRISGARWLEARVVLARKPSPFVLKMLAARSASADEARATRTSAAPPPASQVPPRAS